MPVATRFFKALLLAGAFFALPAPMGFAQGDGSLSNNPDLLRGSYSPFCEPAMVCHYALQGGAPVQAPVVSAAPVLAAPPVPEIPVVVSAPLHDPAPYPVTFEPVWDMRASLALRGSIISSGGAVRYEAIAAPEVGWVYRGSATQVDAGASLELVQPADGQARVGAVGLDLDVSHAIGPTTGLAANLALRLSQDDARALGVGGAGTVTAPVEVTGSADASLVQRFGKADVTLSGGVLRTVLGDTVLTGGVIEDNAGRSFTGYRGGLRLGYALTPIVGVFTSGNVGRDIFDAPDIALGASRTGWRYDARVGITANWQDVTTLEASIGSGWRTYDDAGLTGTRSVLYGFALGFNPSESLRLRASFDTALAAGSGATVGGADYTLALEAAYRVNEWLGLRATASAGWLDVAQPTWRYGAGLGADITVGQRTGLTFDYAYGWREDPAAAVPVRDEHRVSAGVTLRY